MHVTIENTTTPRKCSAVTQKGKRCSRISKTEGMCLQHFQTFLYEQGLSDQCTATTQNNFRCSRKGKSECHGMCLQHFKTTVYEAYWKELASEAEEQIEAQIQKERKKNPWNCFIKVYKSMFYPSIPMDMAEARQVYHSLSIEDKETLIH